MGNSARQKFSKMGVDRNDYVIVGYKIPYMTKKKDGEYLSQDIYDNDDKYLQYIEGWVDEPFRIIIDGMSGNYIAFGKEIANADEYEGFDFLELNVSDDDFNLVKDKATNLFNDVDFDFSTPKLLVFSHYS